jgi:alpha-1,3-rhamnosyltransferase
MTRRQPLVSVIVPCFNHADHVRETIESVWAQSYPAVELIVLDDASGDRSAEVVEAARAERKFLFVRNEENLGLNGTLERGLSFAKGEFVSLLASDDLMLPNKVAEQVEWLLDNEADGVFSTGFLQYPDGRREALQSGHLVKLFSDGTILRYVQTNDTHGPLVQSGLFRTEMIRSLAPVRREFKSDDWALTIRMLETYRIGFLDRGVFVYRQHPANAFRSYWKTFPMRAEVLSMLTPPELRREALANLLESQAAYLLADGNTSEHRHFMLAAAALHPERKRIARSLRNSALRGLLRIRGIIRRSSDS